MITGYKQAKMRLPNVNFQERNAAIRVSKGPKTMSGKPTGLVKLVTKHPMVNPAIAGIPKSSGRGVKASPIRN